MYVNPESTWEGHRALFRAHLAQAPVHQNLRVTCSDTHTIKNKAQLSDQELSIVRVLIVSVSH